MTSLFFNTKTMKQHSKTHVNKVLFEKVANELSHIYKNVINVFCQKTVNAREIKSFGIT